MSASGVSGAGGSDVTDELDAHSHRLLGGPVAEELADHHLRHAGLRADPVLRAFVGPDPDLEAAVALDFEVVVVQGGGRDEERHPFHRAAGPDDPVRVVTVDPRDVVRAVGVVAEALVRRRLQRPELRVLGIVELELLVQCFRDVPSEVPEPGGAVEWRCRRGVAEDEVARGLQPRAEVGPGGAQPLVVGRRRAHGACGSMRTLHCVFPPRSDSNISGSSSSDTTALTIERSAAPSSSSVPITWRNSATS